MFGGELGNGANAVTPKPIEIVINTFIPEEWVDNPAEFLTFQPPGWYDTIFGGDARSEFAIDGAHRSQQRVVVNEYGLVHPSHTHAGITTLYDKASSLDENQRLRPEAIADTILSDRHWLIAKDQARDQGTASVTILGDRKLRLRMRIHVADPLIWPIYFNAVDYEVTVTIDFAAENGPTFTMSGYHDGYPNYEIYVNGQRVHEYAHGDRGPTWLFPPTRDVVFDHPPRVVQP